MALRFAMVARVLVSLISAAACCLLTGPQGAPSLGEFITLNGRVRTGTAAGTTERAGATAERGVEESCRVVH